MIDLAKILVIHYGDCSWELHGEDYDGLVWHDEQPKPSEEELLGKWNSVVELVNLKQQLAEAQQYLNDTDYVVVKMAEAMVAGEDITAMKAQYADVISEREVKRQFIGENS